MDVVEVAAPVDILAVDDLPNERWRLLARLTFVTGVLHTGERKGGSIMHRRRRVCLVEECYRRAAEVRRIADAPGTPPAEKDDLLKVERRWLSLARQAEE